MLCRRCIYQDRPQGRTRTPPTCAVSSSPRPVGCSTALWATPSHLRRAYCAHARGEGQAWDRRATRTCHTRVRDWTAWRGRGRASERRYSPEDGGTYSQALGCAFQAPEAEGYKSIVALWCVVLGSARSRRRGHWHAQPVLRGTGARMPPRGSPLATANGRFWHADVLNREPIATWMARRHVDAPLRSGGATYLSFLCTVS
jgi:hypothetical protein